MYIRNSLFLLLFTFVNPLFSLFISSILFFKEKQSFFHVFIVTFAIFIFISSREYGVSWGTYPIVGNDDIPSYISILSSPNNSFIDLLQPLWVAFKLLYNFIFTGYWLLLFSFLSLLFFFLIIHRFSSNFIISATLLTIFNPVFFDIYGHLFRLSLGVPFAFLSIILFVSGRQYISYFFLSSSFHLSFIITGLFFFLKRNSFVFLSLLLFYLFLPSAYDLLTIIPDERLLIYSNSASNPTYSVFYFLGFSSIFFLLLMFMYSFFMPRRFQLLLYCIFFILIIYFHGFDTISQRLFTLYYFLLLSYFFTLLPSYGAISNLIYLIFSFLYFSYRIVSNPEVPYSLFSYFAFSDPYGFFNGFIFTIYQRFL